jgi:hypothetical protein
MDILSFMMQFSSVCFGVNSFFVRTDENGDGFSENSVLPGYIHKTGYRYNKSIIKKYKKVKRRWKHAYNQRKLYGND